MPEFQSNAPEETEMIARKFAKNLKPFDFVSLTGHLGAGKTKFTSGIVNFFCTGIHGKDYILSPTYAIMNSYDCSVTVNHFDFYRLKGYRELEDCGFFDSLSNSAITVAEWTNNIAVNYEKYVEGDYYKVNIEIKYNDVNRYIKIEKVLNTKCIKG